MLCIVAEGLRAGYKRNDAKKINIFRRKWYKIVKLKVNKYFVKWDRWNWLKWKILFNIGKNKFPIQINKKIWSMLNCCLMLFTIGGCWLWLRLHATTASTQKYENSLQNSNNNHNVNSEFKNNFILWFLNISKRFHRPRLTHPLPSLW